MSHSDSLRSGWLLLACSALATHSTAWALNPAVQPFVPQGWQVIWAKSPDLDGDGRSDRALVLEQMGADSRGARSLVLLRGTPDGFRLMTRAADSVLLCRECGGVRGDPLDSVTVGRGWIQVTHYGGSNWVWAFTHTFELSGGSWNLTSLTEYSRDPFSGERNWTVPPSECESVRLDTFKCGRDNYSTMTVTSKQAFFYSSPRKSDATRQYVVAGQTVSISRIFNTFVEASYTDIDGKRTEGFLRLSDLSW